MKTIVLLIFLIFVTPTFVFGADVDDIVKLLKDKESQTTKQKEMERGIERAAHQRLEEVTEIIASKIKELMDGGVKFKKDPGDLGKDPLQVSRLGRMLGNRLLVSEGQNASIIQFQPEGGKTIEIWIWHNRDGTATLVPQVHKLHSMDIEFKPSYDPLEIKERRNEVQKLLVKLIKDAIKNK